VGCDGIHGRTHSHHIRQFEHASGPRILCPRHVATCEERDCCLGLLEARLLGVVVPVTHIEGNPDINAGTLMRWLAESLLFPTVQS
jgi:hypothetical protein